MITISETTEFHIDERTAVAIGKFDGIHLGHKALLDKLLMKKEEGLKTVVFSFYPSPSVLFTGKEEALICTRSEKKDAMERAGIDYYVEFPFDKKTASTDPKEFIKKYLIESLNAAYIVAGSDVSFGKGGKGNADLLRTESERFGYELLIIDKIRYKTGEEISSTLVRNMIIAGKMNETYELMGEYYRVSGIVNEGKKLGRTLDMPTANIYPPEGKLLPENGVYFTISFIEGDKHEYPGVTNVGVRPSINDGNRKTIETHLLDFDDVKNGELYGRKMTVMFVEHLRKEVKFRSTDELKETVKTNIKEARKFFLNFKENENG